MPTDPDPVTVEAARPTAGAATGASTVTVRGWAVLVAGILLALGALYAALRWPGLLPVGSDNDEYRIVGEALARLEPPVVAGVEGTKYPLGYPAVLAILRWLGLPPAVAAMWLNLASLAVTAGLLGWIAGRPRAGRAASPGAGLAAGGLVMVSAAVWNDVFSVMPELLLLMVVASLLVQLARPLDRRRLAWLTLLSVVAVSLKSMAGLLVAGMTLGLLVTAWRTARRGDPDDPEGARDPANTRASDGTRGPSTGGLLAQALAPLVAAVLTVGGGMVAMARYPQHTTGYLPSLLSADPADASQGTIDLAGFVSRTLAGIVPTLSDLGRAVTLIRAEAPVAVTVAVVLLGLGVVGAWRLRPATPLGPAALGMVVVYAVGMVPWPFSSSRFGLPLVPVAALGVGWLVRAVTPRPWPGLAVGAVVLVALGAVSLPVVAEEGEADERIRARQHQGLAEVRDWAATDLEDDDVLVSFDYREIARVLDRPVRPLAYSDDPDDLLAQVGDATHLVVLEIHPRRQRQAQRLLQTHEARFEPVLETDTAEIHEVQR